MKSEQEIKSEVYDRVKKMILDLNFNQQDDGAFGYSLEADKYLQALCELKRQDLCLISPISTKRLSASTVPA